MARDKNGKKTQKQPRGQGTIKKRPDFMQASSLITLPSGAVEIPKDVLFNSNLTAAEAYSQAAERMEKRYQQQKRVAAYAL